MSLCNLTAYAIWRDVLYTNTLRNNYDFWIYPSKPEVPLTNGLALDLVTRKCIGEFSNLYLFLSGKNGPVSIQQVYDAMCSDYCLENDRIHYEAMQYSHCNCLELSTPPSSAFYNIEGDYCLSNSARRMCMTVGYCGKWGCDLNDYMCPRYEFNKMKIDLRGYGSCINGTNPNSFSIFPFKILFALLFAVTLSLLYQ
jgi:hypothetical protein